MATAEKPSDETTRQELPDATGESSPDVRITFGAWLRSMWAIAHGVFLHPFSTSYVDLSTGKSVQVPN
ncbi:MAG: hypothetical protein L0Y72_29275 [Gemmataceae bacterium]|nr:hypothetical protein [Gemmataceae bacterium]MCI0743140.1 hypothetical protein [Gemmataceae bacterium]